MRVSESAVDARAYAHMARIYDVTFGPVLQAGRRRALERLALAPGDHLLEVGVGTGINLPLYPAHCRVTGVDLSPEMLRKARQRVDRLGGRPPRLLEMDASALSFRDNTFDVVYAAYTVSAVPEPLAVVREMQRVCKPGGRIVMLSHFQSEHPWLAAMERWISPLTRRIGFTADLRLPTLLERAGLRARSIEGVNLPPIWSLVTCVKEPAAKTSFASR